MSTKNAGRSVCRFGLCVRHLAPHPRFGLRVSDGVMVRPRSSVTSLVRSIASWRLPPTAGVLFGAAQPFVSVLQPEGGFYILDMYHIQRSHHRSPAPSKPLRDGGLDKLACHVVAGSVQRAFAGRGPDPSRRAHQVELIASSDSGAASASELIAALTSDDRGPAGAPWRRGRKLAAARRAPRGEEARAIYHYHATCAADVPRLRGATDTTAPGGARPRCRRDGEALRCLDQRRAARELDDQAADDARAGASRPRGICTTSSTATRRASRCPRDPRSAPTARGATMETHLRAGSGARSRCRRRRRREPPPERCVRPAPPPPSRAAAPCSPRVARAGFCWRLCGNAMIQHGAILISTRSAPHILLRPGAPASLGERRAPFVSIGAIPEARRPARRR